MDLTWSNSLSFYKIDFKRNKKTRMNERYSHIHIFMSYSYPTRVVNGYWLQVFVVLVFRLSNSVSVFIVFREWVGPTKVHKNLGNFEEEEAHWVWVSELCRCWFCFCFFFFCCWTPHGTWSKIFISTFSTTIDIQRFKLKTFSLIYIYIYIIFFSLFRKMKRKTHTQTRYIVVLLLLYSSDI